MSPKTKKQKTAGSPPAIAVSPTQSLPSLLPAPLPIAASMPLPSPTPLSAVAARRQKLLEAAAATLASALATNTAASPENDPEEHADVDDLGGDDDEKESLKSKESGDTSEDSQSSDSDSSSEEEDGRPVGVPRSKGAATSNHGIRRERKSLLGAGLSEFMATEKFDSVIALRSANNCGIIGVEKVVPLFKGIFTLKNVGRPRAQEIDESDVRARFETCCQGFYPIMEPTENIAALKTSKNWNDAIQVLLNATEDENALGVPFTHLRQPYRAFFAGNSTPRDDPDYYMDCIRELVRTYYSEIVRAPEWRKHDSTNGDEDFDDYQSDDDDDENFIPLIINTQGWIKGMGYDLLMQLLDYTAPSHIFGLYSPSSSDLNLPPQFFTVVNAQTQMDTTPDMLDSRSSLRRPVFSYVSAAIIEDSNRLSPFTKYHPADHRALSLVSYFYLKQEDNPITTSTSLANEVRKNKMDLVWDFGHALVVRRPWCWDWTHAKGIWVLFEQVPPSQILYALNGSLVALIGDKEQSPKHENASGRRHGDHSKEGPPEGASEDDKRAIGAVKGSEETTKNAPPNYFPLGQFPPPPPKHTNCYGLAIIRSIEPSTRTFHLLTPIRQQLLEKCNGVVKGALHMPLHTSLDHNDEQNYENGVAGVPWKRVPYLHYEGALGSIVQGGGAGIGTGGGTGGQSPAAGSGSSSPRLGFAPPVKIIGADAKSTRKNLGRKRLQAVG
ncbi:Polynucleotide 5'-hydroxyl-kinase grc3 [Lunasporangiospora selenospora]|uniref:Polynucleotide 5'-hydroxyl-kinase GRC3 n=1 Tax=Lunasporangiospora selenospora TaxID=979761 RepID=A0A9P6G2S9_9FUNG|nr:Polynucleotide 5'-hydroxyl-kinase grc3 [Lunasporangiospora selenospora]